MSIGERLGSRVTLTFFNQSRDICMLCHNLVHLGMATKSINTKVILAEEVDCRWVFGISAVAGQDEKGFVVYCDLSIFQCLRSRSNELNMMTDVLEDAIAMLFE